MKNQTSIETLTQQFRMACDATGEAWALVAATQARVDRCRTVTDGNVARVADADPASIEEVLSARVQFPQLEQLLAEQTLAAREYDRHATRARQALRDALDARYHAELPALVKAAANPLVRAMQAMAALRERQERHATETGRAFSDPAYMPSLLPVDSVAVAWLNAHAMHLDE